MRLMVTVCVGLERYTIHQLIHHRWLCKYQELQKTNLLLFLWKLINGIKMLSAIINSYLLSPIPASSASVLDIKAVAKTQYVKVESKLRIKDSHETCKGVFTVKVLLMGVLLQGNLLLIDN